MDQARQLEEALRNVAQTGTRLPDADGALIWRFDYKGRPFLLQFYRRKRGLLARFARISPAMARFRRLQLLQKAKASAPRAVAVLVGFRIAGEVGDALIVEDLSDAVPLTARLAPCWGGARSLAESREHRSIERQVRHTLHAMGKAHLGHARLTLDAFIARGETVYLAEVDALHQAGLRTGEVLRLAHSARNYSTRADRLRAWRQLQGDAPPPRRNPLSPRLWAREVAMAFGENDLFGRLREGAWSGQFARRAPSPAPWSAASQLTLSAQDWQAAWPGILARLEAGEFEAMKESSSGDVLAGAITVGVHTLHVVIKRPRRKFWYRYLNEIGRGSRSRRAWRKAWQLVVRGIPTAWPLLMMEKRALGYVTDQLTIFERIDGQTLADADWDALAEDERRTLMFRVGRLLHEVEQTGLYLYDAKATNWMIARDPAGKPLPMLIDVDGLRRLHAPGGGVHRLLRSVRQHRHFRAEDQEDVRFGHAPFHPQDA